MWVDMYRVHVCVCILGSTDLLHAVHIGKEEVFGVKQVVGFCKKRSPSAEADVAYRITPKASLNVATSSIFPGE